MSKLELDDQILNHPKFVRAVSLGGADAVFLWLGIRAYCGQHLTDGFVPDDMLGDVRGPRDTKKRARALQVLREVGLIDAADGGVQMHDYLQWSRSKAQVIADRARSRERQAKSRGGQPDPPPSVPPVSRRDSERDDADPSGRVTPASASASATTNSDPTSQPVAEDLSGQSTPKPQRRGRAVGPSGKPRWLERAESRQKQPRSPGEPPTPRHDELAERLTFSEWACSQELLDWAREKHLPDRDFDDALIELRDKVQGLHDVGFWDLKAQRFVEQAITKRTERMPLGSPTGTPQDHDARAKLAAILGGH